MRAIKVVVSASAIAALAACASLGKGGFAEPVVSLRDVAVTGVGLNGGSLDVQLAVYNPNGYTLDATKLTYNIFVGDSTRVGTGQLTTRQSFQKKDTTVVHVPVSFTYAGLGAAGRELMNSGSVVYKVTGDVTVSTPIGDFTRPYTGTGRYSTLSGKSR